MISGRSMIKPHRRRQSRRHAPVRTPVYSSQGRSHGTTPATKLDFHAVNAITLDPAHRCTDERGSRSTRESCDEAECRVAGNARARAFTLASSARVTIITRPQFIIQTLCTGSRVCPSTLIPVQPTANRQDLASNIVRRAEATSLPAVLAFNSKRPAKRSVPSLSFPLPF